MTQVGGARPSGVRDGAGPCRPLGPAVVTALATAFRGEVAERLPRLAAAASTQTPELLAQALRDAHALGSSADLVGAGDAAATARGVEALLRRWAQGEEPVAAGLATLVDLLCAQLDGRPA